MSASSNARAIQAATRELSRKWQETRESWRDAKSGEFESAYLAELFSSVERSLPALEELDKLVRNVRSQCE